MPKTKQLTISAEDRPGTLAQIAKILGDSQVNIIAMNCATFGAHGAVHAQLLAVDEGDIGRCRRYENAADPLHGDAFSRGKQWSKCRLSKTIFSTERIVNGLRFTPDSPKGNESGQP